MAVIPPHLLACQGGIAVRAEIHRRHFTVRKTVLVQLDKEPLGPLVIFRVGRYGFAPPIEHGAHRAHLRAHVVDILVGPYLRMDAALDGSVFGRQAERVEAHWKKHVEAFHAHVAGARVRRRHGIPVTDVQVAGGIRQHGQRVMLGLL